MKDNGEKALEELTVILQRYTSALQDEDHEEIESGLLTLHRVILVLLEIHERTMLECGLTEDQLEFNRDILKQAREIIENELSLGVTMPGGDA